MNSLVENADRTAMENPVQSQGLDDDRNLAEILSRVKLDRTSVVPLYAQIAEVLELCILSGVLAEGSQLPSYDRLGKALNVDALTIRRCYNSVLEPRGFTVMRRGIGTFVKPVETPKLTLASVIGIALRQVIAKALNAGVPKADIQAIFDSALSGL